MKYILLFLFYTLVSSDVKEPEDFIQVRYYYDTETGEQVKAIRYNKNIFKDECDVYLYLIKELSAEVDSDCTTKL